jgi:hypothetical protein
MAEFSSVGIAKAGINKDNKVIKTEMEIKKNIFILKDVNWEINYI